ncbi:MAG: radical SAM protein [Syntrophaceae bacterium]
MKYEGMIIRPPSEAASLLVQVTVGCSHNKCTFCRAYKEKKFRIKTDAEIEEDIIEASHYRRIDKVFLCDGDALIIPQERLKGILLKIKENIRGLQRIGVYANAKSILRKSVADLVELREAGLGIIYLGIESGNDEVLKRVQKGSDRAKMLEAGRRVKEAGIALSATVLLGIAGVEQSREHALDTAKLLTEIDPDFVGALTVMVVPGTPLYEEQMSGSFRLPGKFGLIAELGIMIANSEFTNCFFTSNHASNYLPVRAKLPEEKEQVLSLIENVIRIGDPGILKPEFLRAL